MKMDTGSATISFEDAESFQLIIGAADMGTGCDTILAQMAAEILECEVDEVTVFGADTDASPYDSGSYASSTTYVTGMAVEKASKELRERLCRIGAELMECSLEEVEYCREGIRKADGSALVTRAELARRIQCNNNIATKVTATHCSQVSPPPYMVGMCEIELDRETGEVKVLRYDAVVDCGTPVNPNLARIQTEGGIVQGIGMALYENIHYTDCGAVMENSLMQYKIPSRLDVGELHIAFEDSYEPTGPFGVKSLGEVVINTPGPAIAHAIYRACGKWHRTLPITPEKILLELEDE